MGGGGGDSSNGAGRCVKGGDNCVSDDGRDVVVVATVRLGGVAVV